MNVDRLIHQIEKALREGAPTPHLEELAQEYASCRSTIKERLDKCVLLIRAEKHHVALEVAESPPSLFSLLEKLSCESEEPWQRLCESRGLGIGPDWRQEQVDLLESVYRRGNAEDSPLFREYRDAVRNRDEPRTFQILQRILKEHPGHSASKRHYEQLCRKILDDKIDELGQLIQEGKEQEFLALMTEVETTDWGVTPSGEKWGHALATRDGLHAPPPLPPTSEEEDAPPAGPSITMESLKSFGKKIFENLRNLDHNARRWTFGIVIAIALLTLGLHPALLVALAIYWPLFKLKVD